MKKILRSKPSHAKSVPTYLISGAITQFGELWDRSLRSLFSEAIEQALTQRSILSQEIDLVVVSNMASELYEGQAHLNALVSTLLPHHPPAMRVEAACASGGMAVHVARMAIKSGQARTVLVVGAEKMTDRSTEETTEILAGASDRELEPQATFPVLYALTAQAHMQRHGTTSKDLASVSVKNHAHAMNNPTAQFHTPISIDQVLQSPIVSEPLHLLDCSPITDGAAAIILSSTPPKTPHVEIVGSGVGQDILPLTHRPRMDRFIATQLAIARALDQASWNAQDLHALSLLELHDCFTIAEILAVEDLGLCKPGEGVRYIRDHAQRLNTSGGLKGCGHPIGATGVKQAAWIWQKLQAQPVGSTALSQNVGGAGATAVVHLYKHLDSQNCLEKERPRMEKK